MKIECFQNRITSKSQNAVIPNAFYSNNGVTVTPLNMAFQPMGGGLDETNCPTLALSKTLDAAINLF